MKGVLGGALREVSCRSGTRPIWVLVLCAMVSCVSMHMDDQYGNTAWPISVFIVANAGGVCASLPVRNGLRRLLQAQLRAFKPRAGYIWT